MAIKVFVDSEHCTNYYNKLINYIYEIERYFLQNYIYLKAHENNEFKQSDYYIHVFMKVIIQIENWNSSVWFYIEYYYLFCRQLILC